MPDRKGDYFANKAEAIAYYKEHEENFKDKPDWLIECIIDFAIQYPNYKEYCEVEAKVKSGQELTAKQKKKYGNLKWEKEMTEYEDGQVLKDHVAINEAGTYPDIVNDKEEFEKIKEEMEKRQRELAHAARKKEKEAFKAHKERLRKEVAKHVRAPDPQWLCTPARAHLTFGCARRPRLTGTRRSAPRTKPSERARTARRRTTLRMRRRWG